LGVVPIYETLVQIYVFPLLGSGQVQDEKLHK
jgi:hypothetical protein